MVPPDALPEKETTSATIGFAGKKVKLAARAGLTTTDLVAGTECPAESETVRVTEKLPAVV